MFEFEIRGNYCLGAWETVNTEESLKEAKRSLREYNENEPQFAHKIVKVRVKGTE